MLATLSSNVRYITSIDLQGCRFISDMGVTSLVENHVSLVSLNLRDCNQLTDISMDAIVAFCPSLAKLAVWSTLSYEGSRMMHALARYALISAWLAHVQSCREHGLSLMQSFTALRSLKFYSCIALVDKLLQPILKRNSTLQTLVIEYVLVLALARKKKPALAHSRTTFASHCLGVTGKALLNLYKHNPEIRTLYLDGSISVIPRAVAELQRCKSLKRFSAINLENTVMYVLGSATCSETTTTTTANTRDRNSDSTMNGIAFANLELLRVRGCTKLSNSFLSTFANHSRNLSCIDLSECPQIDHRSLCYLAQGGTALRELSLAETSVTDDSLGLFLQFHKHLRFLNLRRCYFITDRIIIQLAQCPALETLIVASCAGVTGTSRVVMVLLEATR